MLLNDFLVRLDSLWVLSFAGIGRSQVGMGRAFVWIETNGRLIFLYGLIYLALAF